MATNLNGFAWKGSNFKHDMVPATIARHKRKVDKAKSLADAYVEVNRRENNICQVSGVVLSESAIEDKHRREHHHEKGRRVMPEWREDPDHIFLVSALVHGLITAGWIVQEGVGATKARWHWADHVPVEKRPFRIKSRRRSQQREA